MNILHLKYAVEVAKTGSINKAAQNLYIGQPNLSRAIKELEKELGISIFKRSAKGMVPTPDGEEFLNYAVSILKQIDSVEAIYKSGKAAKRRFSISVPRASYIAEAFAKFTKAVGKEASYEFFYKETNAMRAIKNILQSDYTLGIIRYFQNYDRYFKDMLEEKGLSYELVTEFGYKLIMSEKHPLAAKEKIGYKDLEAYTEIAHGDPYVPSLPFSAVLKEELADNPKNKIFVFERASQFELLRENTDTFMWVSPVPSDLLSRYGLVQKSSEDNKRIYKDVLIYRNDYKLNDIDRAFITELCSSKRRYIG